MKTALEKVPENISIFEATGQGVWIGVEAVAQLAQ